MEQCFNWSISSVEVDINASAFTACKECLGVFEVLCTVSELRNVDELVEIIVLFLLLLGTIKTMAKASMVSAAVFLD